jgi:hypothetical protein
MTSAAYLARFREIVRQNGWPDSTTPAELLDRWMGLASSAEEGYRWTIDEYLNELTARDLLEKVVNDPILEGEADVQELRARVEAADHRLRAVLRQDVQIGEPGQPWWRRGVLSRAGDEYVEDLDRIYGIRITPV